MKNKGKFPKSFIKMMKKQKRKKMRKESLSKHIIEQQYNNAKRII